MALPIQYNKRMLAQRIQNHMANGFPGSDSTLTENIVILYIDEALASGLIGQMFALAKLEGNMATPEAYISAYTLTDLAKDRATGYWFATLPQPPISLALGHSITNVYFADQAFGQSEPILPVKAKRVPIRQFMPVPTGTRYWVIGNKIWLVASNNQPLAGLNLYVEMAKTRTDDPLEPMNLPDDAISAIFTTVVNKCKERLGIPQDVILDGLPAGNKSS